MQVNGEKVQSGSTAAMMVSVPYLDWYLSQFLVLEPDDWSTPAHRHPGR